MICASGLCARIDRHKIIGCVASPPTWRNAICVILATLQPHAHAVRQLADEAAAEQEHAEHEDPALDDGDPLPEVGQATSVSDASWNTIALVAPATPVNVADSTKAMSL